MSAINPYHDNNQVFSWVEVKFKPKLELNISLPAHTLNMINISFGNDNI
jgi:hypothetical protein